MGNGWGFDFSRGLHDDYRGAAVEGPVETWFGNDSSVHEG